MAELFELTGLDTVRQNLERLPLRLLMQGVMAIDQEDEAILDASRPLVPVDTSSLQRSGRKIDAAIQGSVVEGSVLYGGLEGLQGRIPRNYAHRVHEDTLMRHPRGGQDHYLSQPLFAATSGMLARFAEQLRNAL
jgi:hypothetical protein